MSLHPSFMVGEKTFWDAWINLWLPDGTLLRGGASYCNGVVSDWTGENCVKCGGSGEYHGSDANGTTCRKCSGTGEAWGPVYLVEE